MSAPAENLTNNETPHMPSGPRARPGPVVYLRILLGALLVTAAEILLKKGAAEAAAGRETLLGIGALGSLWTWAGIACHVTAMVNWLFVLRRMPLAIAYSLLSVVHVMVPVGSLVFLHEPVSLQRWLGIGLVLAGIAVIAGAYARAEEAL